MSDNGELENMKNEIEDLKVELEDTKEELEATKEELEDAEDDGGWTKKMENFFWEVTKYAICIFFILLGIGVAGFGFYGLWIDEGKVYLEMAEKITDKLAAIGLNSIKTKFNWFLFIVGLTPIVPCLLNFITRIMSSFDRFKYCSLVMPTIILQLTLGLYLLVPLLILIVALLDKLVCIIWVNAIPFFTEIFMAILPAILKVILEQTVGRLIKPFTSFIEKLQGLVGGVGDAVGGVGDAVGGAVGAVGGFLG